MNDILGCEECAAVIEILENNLIGVLYEHALILARFSRMTALAVNRNNDRNFILLANDKVIGTKARSGMNTAGTGIERYMLTDDNERLAVIQRMLCLDHFQIRAKAGCENFPLGDACGLHDGRDKLLRHDINLAGRNLNEIILEERIKGNRQVARNRPCRGRPDDEVNVLLAAKQFCDYALVIGYCELDKNGLARNILILDLGLSQSSLIMRAPVNRLLTLVDVALLCHFAKDLDLSRFVIVSQGQIRTIPVTDNAQTLELLALRVNVIVSKLFALGAELSNGNLAAVHAVCLDCLTLDRQTVRIPARNIRRLITHHITRTQNKVLEDLIECVTHMQVSVCIRRAVMQNEKRLAFVLLHQLVIQICMLPVFQETRLALGKTRTHREICFWQIDCIVIILLHWQYSFLSVMT